MEAVLDSNLVFSALHSRGKELHFLLKASPFRAGRRSGGEESGFLVPEFFWREIDEKWDEFSVPQNSKKMNSLRCSRLSEATP